MIGTIVRKNRNSLLFFGQHWYDRAYVLHPALLAFDVNLSNDKGATSRLS
jgi:hypothetical protein